MSIRNSNIGIRQVSGSCWLASILQAIVDCPPLVEYIFQINNNEIIEVQKNNKKIYADILKKIIILRNQEIPTYDKYAEKHNYKSDKFEHEGQQAPQGKYQVKIVSMNYVRHYPVEHTYLTNSSVKQSGTEVFFVTEKTMDRFVELRALPLERWVGILESSQAPLEILIKREMIGWTFDQLIEYASTFSELYRKITTEGIPFLWGDPDFNNLLKSYLYALIFNDDSTKSLNPQPLRKYMFESMNDSENIIESEIKQNFVKYIQNNWLNPLNFLSVIFSNFKNTSLTRVDFPSIPGSFLDNAASIRLPYDMSSYDTLYKILQSSACDIAPLASTFDFLIINNPALLESGARSFSIGRSQFRTELEIDFFTGRYSLCSVVVYKGSTHYVTLTPQGIFNDSIFTSDSGALSKFCEKSNIIEEERSHPGYLWFYAKKNNLQASRLEESKKNIFEKFQKYNESVPYQFLFMESQVRPVSTKLSDMTSLQGSQVRPELSVKPLSDMSSSRGSTPSSLSKEDFNFTDADKVLIPIPERDFSVYKYFKRFTIGDINKHFRTEFKCEPQKNAFDCFVSLKLNYKAFVVNNEIFKSLLAEASSVMPQESSAAPISQPLSSNISTKGNDVILKDGSKVHDSWLIKSELGQSFYEIYKEQLNDETFKDPMDTFINKYVTHDSKWGSLAKLLKKVQEAKKNLKYLKYKNKYLQIKRLENHSKHTF